MWHEILLAIGLLLILEGLFPTLSPKRYKEFMRKLGLQKESRLRKMGLFLMVLGCLLYTSPSPRD